jgi:hypothetical protein
MNATTIEKVNTKLRALPDSLLQEVESYIDFLTFRQNQKGDEVPQWHKDLVLERVQDKKVPVDAFGMLDKLEE